MTQVHIPSRYRTIAERLTFCHSQDMLARDSVPHREAARTPHDVPAVRGSLEFQLHGIRPLMHASALDLEGVVVIFLDNKACGAGFRAQIHACTKRCS